MVRTISRLDQEHMNMLADAHVGVACIWRGQAIKWWSAEIYLDLITRGEE